jgi:hypothetical protein
VLGEWLQQESIGAGVVRARARRKNANDKDEDVPGLWVCFELTTQRQTIELRDQDLAQHEIGLDGANLVERFVPVGRDLDAMAGVGEKVCGERPNVGVTLDDQNAERVGRHGTLSATGPFCARRGHDLGICLMHLLSCKNASESAPPDLRVTDGTRDLQIASRSLIAADYVQRRSTKVA